MPRERVVFFTLHKCASMFVYQVCEELAKRSGRLLLSPNGGDRQIGHEELAASPALWNDYPDACFGPLRCYLPVPDFDASRVILHLRDPRDALVSMFFSYCYSHPGPVPGDTGYRREVAERGIDAFVLAMATATTVPVEGNYGTGASLWPLAGNFRDRYQRYLRELIGKPNVQLLRYEDMMADLRGWLQRAAGQFGINDDAVVDELLARFRPDFEVKGENVRRHIRKATPGDHAEKLQPATIRELNEIFADVLGALGYN